VKTRKSHADILNNAYINNDRQYKTRRGRVLTWYLRLAQRRQARTKPQQASLADSTVFKNGVSAIEATRRSFGLGVVFAIRLNTLSARTSRMLNLTYQILDSMYF